MRQLTEHDFGGRFRRKPEDDQRQETEQHARENEYVFVKDGNPLKVNVESQVRVGRRQTRIVNNVPIRLRTDQLPFVTFYVVACIYRRLVLIELNVEFESIVRPRSELHFTFLNIVWKVGDVDAASGLEYRRGHPQHGTVARYDCHRFALFL